MTKNDEITYFRFVQLSVEVTLKIRCIKASLQTFIHWLALLEYRLTFPNLSMHSHLTIILSFVEF